MTVARAAAVTALALAVALARMLARAERQSDQDRAPATHSRPGSVPAPSPKTDGSNGRRPDPELPAADQAVTRQERDLASGEDNAS